MSVSVVIICYNGAEFLREAVESAFRQTRPPDQVIVVDDGSTDDTPKIAAGIRGVELIQRPNGGISLARNTGLESASGEFVVFLDSDDRLLPDALEIGLLAHREHPDCGYVYGFNRTFFMDGRPPIESPLGHVTDACYRRTLEGNTTVPPGSVMFRRSAVQAVGGFRKAAGMTEDYDMYLRVSRERGIYCHNQVVIEYRMHGANITNGAASRSLRSALWTLEQQRDFVRGKRELERALEHGKRHWARVFGPRIAYEVAELLRRGRIKPALQTLVLALRWYPRGLVDVAREYARKLAA